MSKSKNTLDKLFGSRIRVKILKFMFRNYPGDFSIHELSRRIQESSNSTQKELLFLTKFELINKNKVVNSARKASNGKSRFSLNSGFEFFEELRALILKSSPAEKDQMIKRISSLGRVKLAVVSGIFLNNNSSDIYDTVADLFIVGDDISKKRLKTFLASLEAEVGREIKFSLMDKDEFQYRYGMFDRFIRVLLESPHEKIINKLGL